MANSNNTIGTNTKTNENLAIQRFLSADPFLAELFRGLPVCFAGIPHAKESERQQNFLNSAQMAKRIHIAIPSNGLNLHLSLSSVHLVPEHNEVHFLSEFLFNGSRVRLHGHINVRTLQGKVQSYGQNNGSGTVLALSASAFFSRVPSFSWPIFRPSIGRDSRS